MTTTNWHTNIPDLSPEEACELLASKKAIPFDVNGSSRAVTGIVPGARVVDPDLDPADLPEDKETTLIFYCTDVSCGASLGAASRARELGYVNACRMSGGIHGWRKVGLAVDRFETVPTRTGRLVAIPEDGLISDFRRGLETTFGAGWAVSTDREFGFGSTAVMEVVAGDPPALRLTGNVSGEGFLSWAGARFTPGSSSEEPADLSRFASIGFLARGHAAGPTLMAFSGQGRPAQVAFELGADWRLVRVPFAGLKITGKDLTGLMVCATQPGDFEMEIADVRLCVEGGGVQ